jgi:CRP/FNR family cyclic AMP-dependent transcriptional regulator
VKLSEKMASIMRGQGQLPQTKLAYLSTVDIFQDMAPEELKELQASISMTTCAAGKIFYSPNQHGEVVFILKKGKVQIYKMSSEGRKLVLETLGPGTMFGEMSLVGAGLYDAFAEAMEDALICVMNRRDVERLIQSKPQIGIRLLDAMARRLRESEERLEQTLFQEVPSRLSALLLRLRSENGTDTILTTHEELADHLGVYRETVTTALNKLKKDGLVSISRKRVEIVNVEELEARAES